MGVKIAMGDNKLKLFEVMGLEVHTLASQLQAKGVDFAIGFFTIGSELNGKILTTVNLDVSSTALLKKTADPALFNSSKAKLLDFLAETWNKVETAGVLVSVGSKMHKLEDFLKQPEPMAKAEGIKPVPPPGVDPDFDDPLPVPVPPPKKSPTKLNKAKPGVVKLAQAETLLQKVKGTSEGSVYVTIAISPQLKIAARMNDNALSLRAEGPIPFDKGSVLETYGLTEKGGYWSAHFSFSELQHSERLIGALLFDHRLGLDQRVGSIKEIV